MIAMAITSPLTPLGKKPPWRRVATRPAGYAAACRFGRPAAGRDHADVACLTDRDGTRLPKTGVLAGNQHWRR